MITLNNKNFFLSIFILSVASIIAAIYIEYFLGIKPCALCIYQRLPYIFAIFICFFGINYNKNFLLNYMIILIFLISSMLSVYHVGVENGFFSELASCKNNTTEITDKQKLLEIIKNQNVSCKDVIFRIFGLSLATINLIISLTVVIFGTIFTNYEQNKQKKT